MGEVLIIQVKNSNSKENSYLYKNKINLQDSSLILLVLQDLETLFEMPFDKVVDKYLRGKEKKFPI